MKGEGIRWVRLTAEGGAIVVSILLAFVIDAGWDRRGEIVEEGEILTGLRAHFEDVQARLDLWVGIYRVQEDLTARGLTESGMGMSAAAADSMLSSVWVVNVIDRGGGPLDALLASGRLELIRDRQLRERLASWPDRMEDIHTNDLSFRGFVWEALLPYMASHGVPDGSCVPSLRAAQELIGERVTGFLYCVHETGLPESSRALMTDPEFRSLLTYVHMFRGAISGDYADARDAARDVISLIEANLSD